MRSVECGPPYVLELLQGENKSTFLCTTVDTELASCLFNKETTQVLDCTAVLSITEHRVNII